MRASLAASVILGGFLTSASLFAQDVIVNRQPVTAEQIQALQQRLGIPANVAAIAPGSYWYDRVSGLWGLEGGPTVGQIFPDLDLGGPLPSDISAGGTGVFINGREIHPQEALYLQQVFGYVLPGRYWLDWMGNGGYEGGPAIFNLRAAAAASGAGGLYGGSTTRTPFGGLGSDGNCSYYMHPNGSSVMNCG